MINNQNIGVLSEKVARLESDVKTLALPPVEAADEGKALIVNDAGAWEATTIDGDNVIYSEGVSVNDKIDAMNAITTPIVEAVSGVTNASDVKIIGNVLYVNVDVTYAEGASEWNIAFIIKNITKTLPFSFFGVVINGTGTSSRCVQVFQSGTDITVRVRYPQAEQYRGQLILPLT